MHRYHVTTWHAFSYFPFPTLYSISSHHPWKSNQQGERGRGRRSVGSKTHTVNKFTAGEKALRFLSFTNTLVERSMGFLLSSQLWNRRYKVPTCSQYQYLKLGENPKNLPQLNPPSRIPKKKYLTDLNRNYLVFHSSRTYHHLSSSTFSSVRTFFSSGSLLFLFVFPFSFQISQYRIPSSSLLQSIHIPAPGSRRSFSTLSQPQIAFSLQVAAAISFAIPRERKKKSDSI